MGMCSGCKDRLNISNEPIKNEQEHSYISQNSFSQSLNDSIANEAKNQSKSNQNDIGFVFNKKESSKKEKKFEDILSVFSDTNKYLLNSGENDIELVKPIRLRNMNYLIALKKNQIQNKTKCFSENNININYSSFNDLKEAEPIPIDEKDFDKISKIDSQPELFDEDIDISLPKDIFFGIEIDFFLLTGYIFDLESGNVILIIRINDDIETEEKIFLSRFQEQKSQLNDYPHNTKQSKKYIPMHIFPNQSLFCLKKIIHVNSLIIKLSFEVCFYSLNTLFTLAKSNYFFLLSEENFCKKFQNSSSIYSVYSYEKVGSVCSNFYFFPSGAYFNPNMISSFQVFYNDLRLSLLQSETQMEDIKKLISSSTVSLKEINENFQFNDYSFLFVLDKIQNLHLSELSQDESHKIFLILNIIWKFLSENNFELEDEIISQFFFTLKILISSNMMNNKFNINYIIEYFTKSFILIEKTSSYVSMINALNYICFIFTELTKQFIQIEVLTFDELIAQKKYCDLLDIVSLEKSCEISCAKPLLAIFYKMSKVTNSKKVDFRKIFRNKNFIFYLQKTLNTNLTHYPLIMLILTFIQCNSFLPQELLSVISIKNIHTISCLFKDKGFTLLHENFFNLLKDVIKSNCFNSNNFYSTELSKEDNILLIQTFSNFFRLLQFNFKQKFTVEHIKYINIVYSILCLISIMVKMPSMVDISSLIEKNFFLENLLQCFELIINQQNLFKVLKNASDSEKEYCLSLIIKSFYETILLFNENEKNKMNFNGIFIKFQSEYFLFISKEKTDLGYKLNYYFNKLLNLTQKRNSINTYDSFSIS